MQNEQSRGVSKCLACISSRRYGYGEAYSLDSFLIQYSAVITRCDIKWYCRQQWLMQNISLYLFSQKTPHISPLWASYGVSIVRILEKIDRVITAPHCICIFSCTLSFLQSNQTYSQLFRDRLWNNGFCSIVSFVTLLSTCVLMMIY